MTAATAAAASGRDAAVDQRPHERRAGGSAGPAAPGRTGCRTTAPPGRTPARVVTSTPTAITTSAGARVTSRRTTSGIRRAQEALHHDLAGERADTRGGEAGGEQRQREQQGGGRPERRAEARVGALDRGRRDAAAPDSTRAATTQHDEVDDARPGSSPRRRRARWLRSSAEPLLLGGPHVAVLGERRRAGRSRAASPSRRACPWPAAGVSVPSKRGRSPERPPAGVDPARDQAVEEARPARPASAR